MKVREKAVGGGGGGGEHGREGEHTTALTCC